MGDLILNARISRLANRRPESNWLSAEDREKAIDAYAAKRTEILWKELRRQLRVACERQHNIADTHDIHAVVQVGGQEMMVLARDRTAFTEMLGKKARELAGMIIEKMTGEVLHTKA